MTRRTPSYILEQRAANAKKREQYYATRNTSADTTNLTVVDLPRIQVGYRSLLLKTGATPVAAQLQITASKTAINFFEGLAATESPTNSNVRLGLLYTGLEEYLPITKFAATKIVAIIGGPKVAGHTAWGTRVIKYTANAAGTARNSYTAPLSKKSGAFTLEDIKAAASAIKTALGTATLKDNGRITLKPEMESYSIA